MTAFPGKTFVLLDTHAIIHRAYHALPPLTTPAGEPAGAVYGFTTILLRILRELEPDYLAAAFDLPGPTFRHAAYERYKATRPETPGELASQFEKVRQILEAFRIPVFQKQGYEADDIIGTIAEKMKKERGVETIIVTGDMDALQLVRRGVKVYAMRKGISDTVTYDEEAVRERYGFGPGQVPDFKGLKGDPSDNIPGVEGIGEKTATDLLQKFGSLEGIYRALKKGAKGIAPATGARLRAGEQDAKFSQQLAMIQTHVPIDFSLGAVRWTDEGSMPAARAIFEKFGFASLLKRLSGAAEKENKGEQGTLSGVSLAVSRPAQRIDSAQGWKRFAARSHGKRVGILLPDRELMLVRDEGIESFVASLDEAMLRAKPVREFFRSHQDFFGYDIKSLIRFLRGRGVIADFSFDVMLAAYLGEALGHDFSYGAIVARETGAVARDPADGAERFFDVVRALDTKLQAGKLHEVYADIEMPITPILADMEERGVLIDCPFLSRLGKKVDGELAGLTRDIHALAGTEFNINSSQQLSVVLFDRLGIKTLGLRKTAKGGVISTRESELDKLKGKHPIIEKILLYRELAKLKTTYIDVLPALVDANTSRLHTTFNQTGTSTGRLSSSNPNLQNIPVLSENGREIRKAFVAPAGFSFVSFDYSQVELRVAAHLAHDKKMIAAFRQGLDIHKMTAAEVYNVALDEVTPELRRAAKTLNFGVLYGMGPNAFAESTGLSREQAKKFIDEYFHDFSGIREYIDQTKQFAREHGYAESLFGRRRYIPEILSSNPRTRSEAERMAINMPIQGTATGDIVKLAMIKVDAWVKKEKAGQDIRMLLQVHDELVFEIRSERREEFAERIKSIMEGAARISVPLVVDVKSGPNWGEQEVLSGT